MYIDVVFCNETNTAVKLTMDENANYYLVISKYPYQDIRPLGDDPTMARVKFAQAIEYYRKHSVVF